MRITVLLADVNDADRRFVQIDGQILCQTISLKNM